jgi:hypothetical protein
MEKDFKGKRTVRLWNRSFRLYKDLNNKSGLYIEADLANG